MNMQANPTADTFGELVKRLRAHVANSPPQEYRCIRCFDTAMLTVPHPKGVKLSMNPETGEVLGGWLPPCLELSVTCSCPLGSEKYARVNDWLREHKKDAYSRMWSIHDYLRWLCETFFEIFGTDTEAAKDWLSMQTPAGKAAILKAAREKRNG